MAAIAKDVENMIGKQRTIMQELLRTMGLTIDTAVSLEKLNESQKVEQTEEILKSYIDMERKIKEHITALEHVKDSLPKRVNDDIPEISEIFENRVRELEATSAHDTSHYKKHQKYRDFKQNVWRINHPDEALPGEENEDLVVMSRGNEDVTICPITKTKLVEPMKSNVCGHTYSKEAIIQYLKNKKGKQAKCPVAGCNATITLNSVEHDVEMERKLKKKKRKSEAPEEEDDYTEIK